MEDIYYSPKEISQATLFSQVNNVKPDRTGEDLLFQVMLELGATLDSKIETTTVAGKTGEENPFYEYYDEILDICEEYDVTISLGDACRPGCLADATDVCRAA